LIYFAGALTHNISLKLNSKLMKISNENIFVMLREARKKKGLSQL